jgi:hypothetical protein
MMHQDAKKKSEEHVADNHSDENAPLIEPASIIYLINQYRRKREEKKSYLAAAAEKVSGGFKVVKETAQHYLPIPKSKNNEEEIQRDRDKICDDLIKKANNITPENILLYLFKAGHSADKIQQMKEQQWIPSTSDFMECMHAIRTIALWKIFVGKKANPRQKKEAEQFSDVIEKKRDTLLEIIASQNKNFLSKQGINISEE